MTYEQTIANGYKTMSTEALRALLDGAKAGVEQQKRRADGCISCAARVTADLNTRIRLLEAELKTRSA